MLSQNGHDVVAHPGTVFIVDDDAAVRRSLARLMRASGLEVRDFRSAQEFLAAATVSGPSCVVLDLRMPGMTGLELQAEMERRHLELPIIFVTGHGDVPSCAQALKAGALEFLEKPFDGEQLLESVRQAIARHRLEQAERAEIESIRARLSGLTPREYEVLTYVITGMLNKQIAGKLGTAEKTIKVHRGRVMQKMQVESVAELVRLAEKVGLRGPEDEPGAG